MRGDGSVRSPEHNVFSSNTRFWYDAASLPSEQRLIECAAAFANNPLMVRALYRFLEHSLDGKPLALKKDALAAALAIGEQELEEALRPWVADGTLRWGKDAAGEEYFEWLKPNAFLLLLAIS